MSRIYIVSEFLDKSLNSTGYYWEKITENLIDQDYQVVAVSVLGNANIDNTRLKHLKLLHPLLHSSSNIMLRLLYQAEISLRAYLYLIIRLKAGDKIFIGTNPALLAYFIPLIKLFKSVNIFLLSHDVFPDNLIATKVLRKQDLLFKILSQAMSKALSKTDKIIAIGRDMKEILEKKISYKISTEIRYIPNFIITDSGKSSVPKIHKFIDEPDFLYFGNFGRAHGIPELLSFINEISHKGYKSKFIFYGSGYYENKIKMQAKNSNIVLKAPIPFSRNQEGYIDNSISIVTLDSEMYGLAVPSKAYFCLAQGIKFIYFGPKDSELHRLLVENPNLGWWSDITNQYACIKLIENIIKTKPNPFHQESDFLNQYLDQATIMKHISAYISQ